MKEDLHNRSPFHTSSLKIAYSPEDFLKANGNFFAELVTAENRTDKTYHRRGKNKNGRRDPLERRAKSSLKPCRQKNKPKEILTNGQPKLKRSGPVAFVLCDGEICQLMSPAELKASGTSEFVKSKTVNESNSSAIECDDDLDHELNFYKYDPDFQTEHEKDLKAHESEALTFHFVNDVGQRLYTCDICSRVITSERRARKHSRTHKDRTCTICRREFASRQAFRVHCVAKHQREKLQLKEKNDVHHQCSICDSVFKHYSLLRNHLVEHTVNKRFHCAGCSKSFASYSQWLSHRMRLCSGNRSSRTSRRSANSKIHPRKGLKKVGIINL